MDNVIKFETPKVVEEAPLPSSDDYNPITAGGGGSKSGIFEPPAVEKQQLFPLRKVATELISSVLNTKSKAILQSFQLTQSGGFQIGTYQNGVTGDLRITPTGITGRNSAGITTFGIDAETGDAVFAGQIQGESVVTGLLAVGGNAIVLDGEGQRITMTDDAGNVRVLIGDDSI